MTFLERITAIFEGIEAKIPKLLQTLTSQKSQWVDKQTPQEQITEFIKSLTTLDPTAEIGTYIPYIVVQLAKGTLKIGIENPEDSNRISKALKFYHTNKTKPQFELDKDINKINDWRTIEQYAEKLGGAETGLKSKRQEIKELTVGSEKLLEITVPNKHKTKYRIYKITEPEALATMGMGTTWCTTELTDKPEKYKDSYQYHESHPKAGQEIPKRSVTIGTHSGYPMNAIQYLSTEGPIYIIFRTGDGEVGKSGQLLQFTMDGSQCMGHTDQPLVRCSPALDWTIAKWLESGTCDAPQAAKKIREMCVDYEGRP